MACTIFPLQGRQLHNKENESCLSCTRHAYWSLLFIPTKYYQIISNSMGFMACTRFRIQEKNYITKKVRDVTLARNIPNIIKICLRVSKLWPAQDFHFRRDNYTKNKMRAVSLTRRLGGSVWCAVRLETRRSRVQPPAEVGNILSWRLIMKYFLRSFSPFRWLKKGSCQFLAKECAQYWLTA